MSTTMLTIIVLAPFAVAALVWLMHTISEADAGRPMPLLWTIAIPLMAGWAVAAWALGMRLLAP